MRIRIVTSVAMVACAIALSSGIGVAHAEGWTLRVGGHYVEPKSNNHAVVNVDSAESLTFNVSYNYTPNWSVELLAALPFKHDVNLNADGSKVATVKHLPPTLTLQYLFLPQSKVRPYVGAGLNATIFFNESTRGALAGQKLSLGNSFGPAVQAGVDIDLDRGWFLGLDARWLDIQSHAHLSGANLGDVKINPLAFGVTVGHRFGR
jgi:outer membrane protein